MGLSASFISIPESSASRAVSRLKLRSNIITYDYKLGANFSLSAYSGDYTENQTVKATIKVPGVTLRYTLNGKIPTEKSSEFPANGLKIENTASLYVMAFKDGWSEVGYNETYNINKLGNYKTHYYYNLLPGSEKAAYKRIVTAVENGDEKVSLTDLNITNTALFKIAEFINNDTSYKTIYNKQHWYAYKYKDNCCTDVIFNYAEEWDKNDKELEKKAAKVIDAAKKQPTAYDKLKYIHDWIVDNTDYYDKASNTSTDVGNAYGVIVEGKGGCGGFARAFQYLAQGLGFDCIIIIGNVSGNDTLHAWNMVKLNGTWYHTDVCWDDLSHYGDNKIYYKYFLKSEKTMSKDHTPRKDYEHPSAPKDYPVK